MKRHASLTGNDRGSVLLVCLFILALLSIFGMIALDATDAELKAAGKQRVSLRAFYAAESGAAEAMRRLKEPSSSSDYIGDTNSPHDPDWSAYILTEDSWATSDDPNYDSDLTNYIPTSSDATNTTIQANSKQSDLSYFVRIKHKREYDAEQAGHTVTFPHYLDNDAITAANSSASRGGIIYYGYGDPFQPTKAVQFSTSSTTQHHPVEIITTYGMSADGFKRTEIEVARSPGVAVVGAIYTEGDFTGNGNSATISGVDHCGSVSDVPAIYNLDPATTSISGGTVDGTIENGSDDLDLGNYIDILKASSSAITTLTADVNGAAYGSAGNFVTVYSETSGNVGGLRLSNIDGYGNLIVEGDLVLAGGFTWTGLVVVTGTLTFSGGGTGVNISGAVMSEDVVDLNGGLEIYYNSCAVGEALSSLGYKVLNWRQF